MQSQELWDSCAQNKTSEISKHALSRILGLLCPEHHVGSLSKMYFQELWDSCAQKKTSEISSKCTFRNSGAPVRMTKRRKSKQHAISGIMGLLCAEQDVGNLKHELLGIMGFLCAEQNVGILKIKCTFKNVGTPVRRTRRRKSQKMPPGSGTLPKFRVTQKHKIQGVTTANFS